MEGVIPSPSSRTSRVVDVIAQHPGVVLLAAAAILGLLAFPALAAALQDHDTLINDRLSLINTIWLVIALALGVACLVARSSLSRDLGEGTRKLIAGSVAASAPAQRGKAGTLDTPSLGAAIVRGVLDLVFLLIIQGIVRTPLVQVISAFEPKALVDGGFVVLVVLIALLMLFSLYRTSQPLTEYLVTVGLDRIVPTAGFAARDLPDAVPTRTVTRTPVARSVGEAGSEPTAIAPGRVPGSEQPTIAALPTMVASSEATVLAVGAHDVSSAEATIAAPPESSATIVDLHSGGPRTSSEATVLEETPPPESPVDATVAPAAPEALVRSEPGATIVDAARTTGQETEATVIAANHPDEPGEQEPSVPGSSPEQTTAGDAGPAAERTLVSDQPTAQETGDTAAEEHKPSQDN